MLDDAIMTYKEAIAREPNFPEAYNNLVSANVLPGSLLTCFANISNCSPMLYLDQTCTWEGKHVP